MIALLIGHVPKDPGFTGGDLPSDEYDYNHMVGIYVREAWDRMGFQKGIVIDVGQLEKKYQGKSNASIIGRQKRALQIGVKCAVEIHHDSYIAKNDYALVFYKETDPVTECLAKRIERWLMPVLSCQNIKRWINVALPCGDGVHPDWGKKWAVQKGYVPTVILEPHSMADPDQVAYFTNPEKIRTVAHCLAACMAAFWESNYERPRRTPEEGSSDRGNREAETEE